jgi:hypothetical protein
MYGRSLSYANDKLGKHREQRRHKILKLFVPAAVISLTVLQFTPYGGGSLMFMRRQSESAVDSAVLNATKHAWEVIEPCSGNIAPSTAAPALWAALSQDVQASGLRLQSMLQEVWCP